MSTALDRIRRCGVLIPLHEALQPVAAAEHSYRPGEIGRSEKQKKIDEILGRAIRDKEFRDKLVEDPKSAAKEDGSLSEEDMELIAGGVSLGLQLASRGAVALTGLPVSYTGSPVALTGVPVAYTGLPVALTFRPGGNGDR
jgi:hypothetical protein